MLKDILIYLPSRMVPAIAAFCLNVFIFSRLLKPAEYGYYTLVLAIIGILGAILFRWIEESGLRYFEKYSNKKKNEFLSSYTIIILLIGLMVVGLYHLIDDLLYTIGDKNILSLLQIGIWLIIVKSLYDFFMVINRASFRKVKYSLYSVFLAIGKFSLAAMVLFFTDMRVKGLIIALIFLYSILVFMEIGNYINKNFLKPFISLKILKISWRFGLPLTGVFIMGLLLAVVDKFFIAYFLGAEELGIYSLGYKISEMSIQNVFMVLMLPAYPVIIKKYENEGKFSAGKLIKKYIELYFILLVPILIGLCGVSKEFCKIFLGHNYINTYTIIGLIAAGIFLLGLSHYVVKAFLLLEKTKKIFYFLSLSLLINMVLNIILIPNFGIKGAAYSTLISYLVYLLVSYINIKKNKMFPLSIPWKTFLKTITASGFMLIVLIYIPVSNNVFNFFLKIGLGGVVYLMILIIIKEKNLIGLFKKVRGLFN